MRIRSLAIVISFVLCAHTAIYAQDEMPAIPAIRQLHHEYIIRSLTAIDSLHLEKWGVAKSDMDTANKIITHLRVKIEKNLQLDNNGKYKWLRGVNELLTGFGSAFEAHNVPATEYLTLLKAYEKSMQLDWQQQPITPMVSTMLLETATLLTDNFALKTNIGIDAAKDLLVLKQCERNPARMLPILTRYPQSSYADSLIIVAGKKDPEELYSFAAAPNALGRKIQSVNHPLIKLVSRLSLMRTGRMYFPFLDQIYTGALSMDSITPYVRTDSSLKYYKLLVKTKIAYAERMQKGDTPMAAQVLQAKLKSKSIEDFINDINALHAEKNEAIRFKKLEGLTAEELYYLALMGEEEMYTSSFVSGVYPRIFQRMIVPRSDSLLAKVKYDSYKKFIKMAAAYNKLGDFLDRMDRYDAENLMKKFVIGLEQTNSLEDAVDVADSYSSIYDKQLKKLIMLQVGYELDRCNQTKNKKGQIVYGLLQQIFSSLDSVTKKDLSITLGIPPIYELPMNELKDTSTGKIIIQQFFYGDKDGSVVFNAFLKKFTNPNWKIIKKKQWVEVQAIKGTPVVIYANLPLDETLELDSQAQDSLHSYLEDNAIHPSIIIHRGHSYYLKQTIQKMPSPAKLVVLGSCGGYQKLNDVLEISPGAHIISSKQIGAGVINQGLVDIIAEQLRMGKNLNWPQLWNSLAIRFVGANKEKFDDYVPPHKNLGAIFITAYYNQMNNND
ncbi:MAG: hypothetical protein RL596_564 [Bacteroidota bacterium]